MIWATPGEAVIKLASAMKRFHLPCGVQKWPSNVFETMGNAR